MPLTSLSVPIKQEGFELLFSASISRNFKIFHILEFDIAKSLIFQINADLILKKHTKIDGFHEIFASNILLQLISVKYYSMVSGSIYTFLVRYRFQCLF